MTREARERLYSQLFGDPYFSFEWFETACVPQSLQFMIDCLPAIQELIRECPRDRTLTVLDVGTASGAGAELLATLYRGSTLGPPMKVDALDVADNFKAYADEIYFDINYMVGDIFALPPELAWDIVICSHTIEHIADPSALIAEMQRRARKWLVVYAPYEEKVDGVGHLFSVCREYIAALRPASVRVFKSAAWDPGLDLQAEVVLFVLRGHENLEPEEREALFERQRAESAADQELAAGRPLDMVAVQRRAQDLWKASRHHEATQLLEAVVGHLPTDGHARYLLAHAIHLARQRPRKAFEHYQEALDLGFSEFWVRYSRGVLHMELKEYEKANVELAGAYRIDPAHPAVHACLEQLRKITGEEPLALKAARGA